MDIIPSLTGVEMSLPYIRHDPRLDRFRHLRVDRILPYQAEVMIENFTSIYIPLHVDYRSQARPWDGGIDEDHSIVRAQRLMISMTTATFASVVGNPLLAEDADMHDEIRPRAVIHVPVPRKFRDRDKAPKAEPEKLVLAD